MNIKSGLFYLSIILLFAACQKDYNDPGTGPSQYYGTRSGVSIRAILLAQMPATDPSGNNWDVADSVDTAGRADIFYRFKDIDSIDYPEFVQSFHFDNVNPDSLPLPYFLTTPYSLRTIGSNVQFDIYDFEKSISSPAIDSTLMKSFNFSVVAGDSLIENPYPDSLVLAEDGYVVLLYLNWIK